MTFLLGVYVTYVASYSSVFGHLATVSPARNSTRASAASRARRTHAGGVLVPFVAAPAVACSLAEIQRWCWPLISA
jgi:hypothetical protein